MELRGFILSAFCPSLTARVEAARARGARDVEAEEELRRLVVTEPEPGEAIEIHKDLFFRKRDDPYNEKIRALYYELGGLIRTARKMLSL